MGVGQNKRLRRFGVALPVAAGSVLMAAAMNAVFSLQWLDHKISDVAVRRSTVLEETKLPESDVVLVVIDEHSLQTIPEPLAYWQPHVGQLLKMLGSAHVKAVGLDMVFTANDDRARAESKQLAQVFAEVSEQGTPVVLGYDAGTVLPDSPLYMLAGASSPRRLGYLNLPADDDDFVRRFDPCRGSAFSLGAQLASRAAGREFQCEKNALGLGQGSIALDDAHSAIIPFGHTATPRKFSFAQVLTNLQHGDAESIKKEFAGKIVLVGSDAAQDRHATPLLGDTGRMPGMEIHAAVAQSIYSGIVVRQVSGITTWLMAFGFALLAALSVMVLRWQSSVVAVVVIVAACVMPTFVAWERLWAVQSSPAMLSAFFAGALGFTYRYRTEFRAHRLLRSQFSQYVSPEIVEQIVENGIALGGMRRKVTVLFSDIRGFTTLSEKVPAEELVTQLNEYLSAMSEIIIGNGGYLDKFIGDGILAVYGAPVEQADAAWKAAQSAVEMLERLEKLNADWKSRGWAELKIGIGIHTGEAIVGNMGSSRKLEYTAVGDTVNTASRIESKTKDAIQKYGVHILISGTTADELERLGHPVDIAPMESEALKGKSEVTELFMLRGLHGAGRKGVTVNA